MVEKVANKQSSLLPPTPEPVPWIIFPCGKGQKSQTFTNILDPLRSYVMGFREIRGKICLLSMHGWLVMTDYLREDQCGKEQFLWNPNTREVINLPLMDSQDASDCCLYILSCVPTNPDCMILLVGEKEKFFLFCTPGDEKWTRQSYNLARDDNALNDEYINMGVACTNGTIYAITSHQAVVVIERNHCGTLSVRLLAFEKPQMYFGSMIYLPYMVESDEELYYVAIHDHLGVNNRKATCHIEIFKMDFTKKVWEKVESLVLKGKANTLEKSLGVKINDTLGIVKENVEKPNSPNWIDLPLDILLSITMKLPLPGDYINSRLVCKTWASSLPPTIRWTVNPICSATQCPWLMFSNRGSRTCSFVDLTSNATHSFDMPELLGAQICFSSDGWLLMSKGEYSMFFFNPFTTVTIELPDLPQSFLFSGLSFSSLPTSAECVVFGIMPITYNFTDVCYLRLGEKAWTWIQCDHEIRITLSYTNPVFYDGAFYCLSQERHIGIFDIKDGKSDWTILGEPQPYKSIIEEKNKPYKSMNENYLVGCDGELFSVYVGPKGKWVDVRKWDYSKSKWMVVHSLKDKMLFVSRSTCVSLKATKEGMQNKIYFPITFHDKNNYVYYSLDSRSWHSSFGDYHSENNYETKAQLHSTWIQPSLSWKTDYF
ncbi:hypothetical protein IFM89_021769 [Coptis chinensis]|uniref:KIB1-4 beta-propeller domain-containing protein n=1 Tax=Coptis chinensis TaxID=261450 RepID=A0A835IPC5_9MAGN|nr:hypothetical protein IFM89_021769 [Coptis chinensis]